MTDEANEMAPPLEAETADAAAEPVGAGGRFWDRRVRRRIENGEKP